MTTQDRLDTRIDWAHSEKYSMFGRMTKEWQQVSGVNYFNNQADNSGFRGRTRAHNIGLANTFVPNPTLVLNVLIGTSRNANTVDPPGVGYNGTKIGLPTATVGQFDANTFPQFALDGYATVGSSRRQAPTTNTHNIQLNVTKERGAHSIKFGFMAEAAQLNFTDSFSANFAFNRGMTSGPTAATNSSTTGNTIASLLLGTAASGSAPVTTHNASTQMYYGGTCRMPGASVTAHRELRAAVRIAAGAH